MESLAIVLSRIPGVVAVTSGGSRARGTPRENSDWDFGLYYRNRLDPDHVRALGFEGDVFAPGDWAEPMHGGAWLRVEGAKVDLIYRDLARVENELLRAERGNFDICHVPGYLVGMPSYALVGELALGRVLVGSLPRSSFPAALQEEAARRWTWEADFWRRTAAGHRERDDATAAAGTDAAAELAAAHAKVAALGRWILNEKGLMASMNAASHLESPAMEASDVTVVISSLDEAGVTVWIEGGWGIDALLGEQTRPHGDLDLALDHDDLARARRALETLGFRHDPLAQPGPPARSVLKDPDGRQLDLHPLVFDGDGDGWQQLSASRRRWGHYPRADLEAHGRIAGHPVRCLSPALQFRFHLGYEWSERDEHDVRLLSQRFGTASPPPRSAPG